MPVKYHYDIIQQTEEWYALRCGVLAASDMGRIITAKKLEFAENQTCRDHLNMLLAQRLTKYVPPSYRSDAMLAGLDDEKDAKDHYEKHYAQVKDCGFVTNDRWGFTLGCSPDGLAGEEGGIQVKSHPQAMGDQIDTIITGVMPDEFRIQVQTELLVTERKWWDFVSYSGGLPMLTVRIMPDPEVQAAIIAAAMEFHHRLEKLIHSYEARMNDKAARLVKTERVVREITV